VPPPRVRSLAAFGRRPPVYLARLSLAGIRNPAQKGDEVHRSKNGPLFNYFVGGGNKRLRDNDIEQTCCLGG